MTFRRSNDRPLSCDVMTHRDIGLIFRANLPAPQKGRSYELRCLTCFATWTESTWVE